MPKEHRNRNIQQEMEAEKFREVWARDKKKMAISIRGGQNYEVGLSRICIDCQKTRHPDPELQEPKACKKLDSRGGSKKQKAERSQDNHDKEVSWMKQSLGAIRNPLKCSRKV